MNVKKAWTEEETQRLKELYANTSTIKLVSIFNCKVHLIYNKAYSLGLKKSKEYMSSEQSGILTKGCQRGKSTQFKKGHSSWNKGMKGLQVGGEATQFKHGQTPHNTKQDGAISVRKDKNGHSYQYIRIGLAKWVLLHGLIWEKAHGIIPKDHIVCFKDGDGMNCSLENLELITKKQHIENTRQKDGYIAFQLSRGGGRGNHDANLREELLKHPELLNAKRNQLKLTKTINNNG